ncbi:PIN domain-containing protein, partial [Desulfobulbus sp. US5]|nr:PIN domain-containing protein [Desulfobulbus sp. US5]
MISWRSGINLKTRFERPCDAEVHAGYQYRYLCDKNRPQQIRSCFKKHQGQMCISTVTLGELIFGAERSQQVERNLADIEAMVARMEVLPLDNEAAYHFGQIRAELYRIGQP